VEAVVGVRNLDFAGAGEWHGGLQGEGELLVGGEVVLSGEVNGAVGVAHVFVEQSDRGTGRRDGDGKREVAAVFE